ncbi:MAG: hypothetical protein IPM81_01940 [Saprospirales bacterium]|nr:hypothetical protein [Saprospirales bacterium]
MRRQTDLTPRLITFFEILLSEDKSFDREEIKTLLLQRGIGKDIGQAGRYLSGISHFLTNKYNPHLRQLISFETGGGLGERKEDYYINSEYRELLKRALSNLESTEKSKVNP